uniref:Uncharacterized protein n=1 Tax=Rhizophora mucronata TaxID=61149 RepID=A0A2P2JQY7_RHIMU
MHRFVSESKALVSSQCTLVIMLKIHLSLHEREEKKFR